MFKTITDAMADKDTSTQVSRRYFPIMGVTIEVPGTKSIKSSWKILSDNIIEIQTLILSPQSHGR